mgnify:FL=1
MLFRSQIILVWDNFKQTVKKYMGLSFNYKTEKIYYHKEWNEYYTNEIRNLKQKLK